MDNDFLGQKRIFDCLLCVVCVHTAKDSHIRALAYLTLVLYTVCIHRTTSMGTSFYIFSLAAVVVVLFVAYFSPTHISKCKPGRNSHRSEFKVNMPFAIHPYTLYEFLPCDCNVVVVDAQWSNGSMGVCVCIYLFACVTKGFHPTSG